MKSEWLGRATATIVCTILLAAALPGSADAQVFYMFPGAPPANTDRPALGTTVGLGDDLFRLVGYGRFNINSTSDLGLEVVLDEAFDEWRLGFGADLKLAIIPRNSDLPFDLSFNTGFGFQTGGDATNILIPVGGVISREFLLRNEAALVPYGGFYMLIEWVDFDAPDPGRGGSDTDLDAELRLGTQYVINDATGLFATIHVGDEDRFHVGFNVDL